MRKSSENQRNNRIRSGYLTSGTKVKDLHLHNVSFTPEAPMKPSQIPNRFPPPPLRRSLPLQTSEQYHGYRHQHFGMTPCHPLQPPGPSYYAGFGQVCASNWENSQPPLMSVRPVQMTSVAPPQPHTAYIHFHTPCTDFTPDVRHRDTFSHIRSDPQVKATNPLPIPESRDPPRQDLNKVESSHAGFGPMIQLHKPAQLPSLVRTVKESVPLQRSDSWSPSSSTNRSTTTTTKKPGPAPLRGQERRSSYPLSGSPTSTQDHQRTPPNEKSHTEDINLSLQKRRRESGSDEGNIKKQCLQAAGSDRKFNGPDHSSSSSSTMHRLLSDSERSPQSSESHSRTEPTSENSVKPEQLTPKPCPKQNSFGAKQACIKSMHNNLVVLASPVNHSSFVTKAHDETKKKETVPSTSTSPTHKNTATFNGHTTPNAPKCTSKVNQVRENKMVDLNSDNPALKPSSAGLSSCRKFHRPKKPAIANDIDDLFTPDPMTYVVRHRTLKGRPEEKDKVNILDKSDSSSISTPVSKPYHKETTSTSSSQAVDNSPTDTIHPDNVKISLPIVTLTRVKFDNVPSSCKNKSSEKTHLPGNATPWAVGKSTAPPLPPVRKRSPSLLLSAMDTQSEAREKKSNHEDSLDLDLELNFDFDLDAAESASCSSEDEEFVSLQQIMTRKTKPPDTPEKDAFSEPSTPGNSSLKRNHQLLSNTKTGNYKNNLDQMLKEINNIKRAKEMETELLTACQEDLLRIAEYEAAEENREESISAEQQQFLQRYSLMSTAIREVPPGHLVFHLEKFGRIFNQNTLQLRQCLLSPQETAQKTLLWSSHAQLKLYINIGLFQEAYDSRSPCPVQVTRFLFKMMSVHSERILSEKILQVLCDIAYTAASQKVKNGNPKFKVWVPTLADLSLVLMNMGVPFVSLFPLENLQPQFTEGDLLEDVYIKSENPSSQEPSTFPEHNCNNIFKYLSSCVGLCPRAYTDAELLLLLTLLSAVGLDSRLILLTGVEMYPLLYKVINNIRDWDNMMPKICLALTDLTDDHHNMCHLVQLLPDHSRGKQLRRHLSLSMISKLLDGSCLYRPKNKELQLCDLRLYLSRMKPSSLLRTLLSSSNRAHIEGEEEDMACLDQQVYYLCYSLLTLTNEASNFQFFPAHQKEQLLFLCSELERHVKCHIRESEKCLYRSKVKDLVARIYTKWQMLLQRTRPLNGKLYDYWQPLQGDSASSQEIEEVQSSPGHTEKDDEEEEGGAEKEEMTEEAVMLNGPKEDTYKTLEKRNAAKEEIVEEEIIQEARTEDEKMDSEYGELDQECVMKDKASICTWVEEAVEGNDRDSWGGLGMDSSTEEMRRENTSTELVTTESQGSTVETSTD